MGDDGASWCLVTTPPNFWEGIDIGSNRLAAAAAPPPAAQQWEHPAGNLAPTASAKRARQSAMPSGAASPASRSARASSSFSSCCHCSSARIRSFLSQIDLHGAIYSSVSRTHNFQTSERGRLNSRVSSQCIDSLLFFNGGASSHIYEPRRPHHIIHSLLLRPQRPPRCLLDAPPASTLRSSKPQAMPLAIQ